MTANLLALDFATRERAEVSIDHRPAVPGGGVVQLVHGGVPRECHGRDTADRNLSQGGRCHLGVAAGAGLLAGHCSVHGGASDVEQVGELGGAVLAVAQQRDQVRFLAAVERGLFAAQPPLALTTFMPSRVRSRISRTRTQRPSLTR